ncbi:MAG: archaeosortase/exosortase family protein, partial [Bryobacteraceae bacterium]
MDRRLIVCVAASILASWPVWTWYAARILDRSDEPWCLVALATALVLLLRTEPRASPRTKLPGLLVPSILLLVYAILTFTAPPIVRAIAALAAVGATIAACHSCRLPDAGIWGLLLLAAPLLSSMQFYASYPLRWLMGEVSALLLRTSGLAVTAEGTLLRWGRQIVEIDAPCSGVRMLWAGLFLACVLISLRGLGPWRAIVAGCMAVVAVLCANIARSTALFFLETGIIPLPAWSHVAVGILTFTLAAVAIVWGMPEARPTSLTPQTARLAGDLVARVLFLATCTIAAATAWANPAAP